MKVRDVNRDGTVVNPHSSDFNDDELLNIAAGGGGERMGTRMLAAELLALRTCVEQLSHSTKEVGNSGFTLGEVMTTTLDTYMEFTEFGPRFEAGE